MKLNLEKQWCFDGEGHRIVATVEETAVSICQELVSYPHCVEGNSVYIQIVQC